MLIGLIRERTPSPSPGDRFAPWQAALAALRAALARGAVPGPGDLPAFLAGVPGDQRDEAACDLAAEHLRHAWRSGTGLAVEAYAALFPAGIPAGLVEDEFLARFDPAHGDRPQLEEYERRFPGRPDIVARLVPRGACGGRFALLGTLGEGVSARVLDAWDRAAGRAVALKVARTGAAGAALEREGRILARLDHPGIVRLLDRLDDRGTPVLALEPVRAEPLSARIAHLHLRATADERPALRDALVQALLRVTEAMAHAHARGVVHGDLKPGNILGSTAGDLRVVDWGLAGAPGDPAPPAGTPESMAPEQLHAAAGPRSDVYALAGILFEIREGRPLREWPGGVRPAAWKEAVARSAVPRVREAPPREQALLRRALAPDPAGRPASAEAFAAELREAAAPPEGVAVRLARRLFGAARPAPGGPQISLDRKPGSIET